MNLSGILVLVDPERTAAIAAAINGLPGLEVHQKEPDRGRLIVVQEAADIDSEVDGLRRLQTLPGVVMAEMVYHYFADDTSEVAVLPEHLPEGPGLGGGYTPPASIA